MSTVDTITVKYSMSRNDVGLFMAYIAIWSAVEVSDVEHDNSRAVITLSVVDMYDIWKDYNKILSTFALFMGQS